jgi:hypothetical protein
MSILDLQFIFDQGDTNDSPLYYLNMSLYNMASSIKHKSKDYDVHFKLAELLEEKNFFENIYGKEKKDEVFISTSI